MLSAKDKNNDGYREQRYTTATVAISELSQDELAAMSSLYLQNYDGSSTEIFLSDLREKSEAILLRCNEILVGFTTLQTFWHAFNGTQIRVIYSGDTIVHPAHWGQQQLAFAWIKRIGEFKAQALATPLYWFLLVKGHRTFKYLTVFGKSFYPHWEHDRQDLQPLAEELALGKFGNVFNPASGVVEFPSSRGHLKESIATPSAEEMLRPDTQFFLRRNPGYRNGHELVCVCELELFNMKPLTARIFQRSLDNNRD